MASILISGTSSGFGRVTAIELARRGHRVFAGMRAPGQGAEGPGESLRREAAGAIEIITLDVCSEASVASAVERVVAEAGSVDVVVNNAGVAAAGFTETFTAADAQALFDVNVLGPFRLSRAALPAMRARGAGLLVTVGSTLGREVLPFLALYEATKFALEGLWEAWRYELLSLGIEVVLVQPGTFPTTSMIANMLPPGAPERAGGYESLQSTADGFFAGLADFAASGNAPDPRLVADAIANAIEQPAGARPVRVVVDPNGGGAAARLNDAFQTEQDAILARLGLQELTRGKVPPR